MRFRDSVYAQLVLHETRLYVQDLEQIKAAAASTCSSKLSPCRPLRLTLTLKQASMNPSTPSLQNRAPLPSMLYQPQRAQNSQQRRSHSPTWSVPLVIHRIDAHHTQQQHSSPRSLKRSVLTARSACEWADARTARPLQCALPAAGAGA
jgi:hypothetical protein